MMFGYYLDLALRSFKRNKILTTLMILALGLGIGASITTLTVQRLLSGDPIPQKSARLFHPELDPHPAQGYVAGQTKPPPNMTWTDAMNLLHADQGQLKTVVAMTGTKIKPKQPGRHPFFSLGVMTTSDFFSMFDVPFRYGSVWSKQQSTSRARVVVIADYLNRKLFDGADSVGKIIRIEGHDYRIVGVLKNWQPQPHFYAVHVGGRIYGNGAGVFLPVQSAFADGMTPRAYDCWSPSNMHKLKTAPCMWLSMWVQLASPALASGYKNFLSHYVQQQISLGRLQRPEVALPNVMQFLARERVVPANAGLQTNLAFGFLLICVLNTVGLLLAKCLRRSREIGVRRALGATRRTIFAQFMIESGMVGLAGGLLGLGLAELGLWAVRHQPVRYADLAHLNMQMFAFTFVVALVASLVAGLVPAWRACVVAPAPQLKAA